MAPSSKSAKSKKSAPASPPPLTAAQKLAGIFFRPWALAILAVVVSAVVLGPSLPSLLPNLSEETEYQFETASMTITSSHRWVSSAIVDEVIQQSHLPTTVSLLNPHLTRDIAAAWQRHPWVKHVRSVQIRNDRTIAVEVDYRTPVAFVETVKGLYPIDLDGTLLPSQDFALADTELLPRVRDIQSLPAQAAGQPWGDPVVAAAAKLANVLAPDQNLDPIWNRYELIAIRAPKAAATILTDSQEQVFELETRNGNRIIWGKSPGVDPLEQPVEQKLARLEYLSRMGTLQAPNGPYRIDIRQFEDITLEPLNRRQYR